MGYFTDRKVNEGIHIEGRKTSFDVIVREIIRTKTYREADLEIRGIPDLHYIHLIEDGALIELVDGVEIGIRYYIRPYSQKVPLFLKISRDYKIGIRKYE